MPHIHYSIYNTERKTVFPSKHKVIKHNHDHFPFPEWVTARALPRVSVRGFTRTVSVLDGCTDTQMCKHAHVWVCMHAKENSHNTALLGNQIWEPLSHFH